MAVNGRSKSEILAALDERLSNDAETEFATALDQLDRIAALRIKRILP